MPGFPSNAGTVTGRTSIWLAGMACTSQIAVTIIAMGDEFMLL
jgi:hypothetical protein